MAKKKKLSEMNEEELLAIAPKIEAHARDRSRWQETAASKSVSAAREGWLDENTTAISIRMPNTLLAVLKACAAREGIGYQTLIKRWLHERVVEIARARGTAREELSAKLHKERAQERREVQELAVRRR
jgi:predicted DNA binding CopG/RHH family protein